MLKLGGGGWVGVDQSREGFDKEAFSLCNGWVMQFSAILRGGSSYSITLIGGTHLSLGTNGTVDHTCYIKHSRLEFLLKYSPTG